jgi:hypothetical protein
LETNAESHRSVNRKVDVARETKIREDIQKDHQEDLIKAEDDMEDVLKEKNNMEENTLLEEDNIKEITHKEEDKLLDVLMDVHKEINNIEEDKLQEEDNQDIMQEDLLQGIQIPEALDLALLEDVNKKCVIFFGFRSGFRHTMSPTNHEMIEIRA